ncbi:MAG: flagellar protein FliL [Acidimicrobiaceae bacterium]|nr:flagellar protein FliL [Acidimicrobiaceae bacterium]
MGRKKKDDAAGDAPAGDKKTKKGKGNMIPAVVVAVGLLGGGYFMSGGGGAKAAPAAASPATPGAAAEGATGAAPGATPAKPKAVEGGEVASAGDAITLNLADGRFLKVGLALQLAKGGTADSFAGPKSAKAIDATISYFGAKSYADLNAPGGRDAAKAELSKKVADLYPGKVVGVYFTQFVMQ